MNRPSHRQEEDVTLMPLPVEPEKRHQKAWQPKQATEAQTDRHERRSDYRCSRDRDRYSLFNRSTEPTGPLPVHLPPSSASYLGVFTKGIPDSYEPVTAFKTATKTDPDIVMYYSGWFVPFPTGFANTVASHGAVPLVQMNPDGINIAQIASGRYDGYLSAYAAAVHAYPHPVILSFGHEMNGNWSDWGYRHTSPAAFVAAWRHIVKLFRALGANNVTWLWTVNIINDSRSGKVDSRLRQWWPGSSYVTWVGDRRLLPPAELAIRPIVRANHRPGAHADQRPDSHRRDRCSANRRPAIEDQRPVRGHSLLRFARVRVVSTLRTPLASTLSSTAQRPSPRSERAPAHTIGLVHEQTYRIGPNGLGKHEGRRHYGFGRNSALGSTIKPRRWDFAFQFTATDDQLERPVGQSPQRDMDRQTCRCYDSRCCRGRRIVQFTFKCASFICASQRHRHRISEI